MKLFAPLLVDGYKTGHKDQYPANARVVFSNMTPRGTRTGLASVIFFGLQYFLKEYVIKNWNDSFFSQPIESVVKRYARRLNGYLGPNGIGDQHIRDLHKLGYLPLEFWALPEGSNVPLRVPMYVVFNTRPDVMPDAVFAWITNSIETIASTTIWLPTTSATTALAYRKLLNRWANDTNPEMIDFVPWQGHDFSFRGHTSCESAITSAAGHLLSFTGTDTVPVIDFLEEYYNADSDKELVGGSVAATEHSVMCMGMANAKDTVIPARKGRSLESVIEEFKEHSPNLYALAQGVDETTESKTYSSVDTDGRPWNSHYYFTVAEGKIVSVGHETPHEGGVFWTEGMQYDMDEQVIKCEGTDEVETFRRLIEDIYPAGLVSIVSDTWDFWNVVDPENGICVQLKDKIMAREGKVVIRPDSGDPVKIVSGYMHDELDVDIVGNYFDRETKRPLTENEVKGMVVCLYEIFGGTETTKGYIQLDPHIGAIYGDSITLDRAAQICERLAKKGFASTNVVFGIGSYTYQYVTRDTYGFAVKSTYGEVEDEDGTTRGIEIFKDPKTDDGLKKSAKGLTAVFEQDGTFVMKDQATWDEVKNCAFVQVFSNGKMTKDWTLAEIRAAVAKNL